MKKIITILILTGLVSVSVMAEKVDLTNQFTEGWAFAASVETRAGYNIDSKVPGLKGATTVNISKSFYDTNTTFEEDMSQKIRGKIVVKDLEVKVATGDKSHDYNDTKTDGGLNVNWESVTAWVYFGPNLYIKMGDINSHEVRYVSTISDGDFSVIGYSILTPYYTGANLGRSDYLVDLDGFVQVADTARTDAEVVARKAGKSDADALTAGQEAYDAAIANRSKRDAKSQNIENVSIAADNLKTFAIGFDIPKMFKTEVGFAVKYNYYDQVKDPYNTFNINAMAEVYAMEEKFKFKVKTDAVSGANSDDGLGGITTKGNPLTVGGSISYTHALGKFNIVPAVGVEVQFEEKRKVNPSSTLYNFTRDGGFTNDITGQFSLDKLDTANGGNKYAMTTPYEVGFGLAFNWVSLGKKADRSFEGLAKGNVGTTDGVSLSGFVGEAPYSPVPDISMKYYGVQLSFWDSEEDDKPGLIPGVSFGIIGNLNYAPGGTLDLKGYANGEANKENKFKTYELKLGNRVDAGVGTVMRVKLLGSKLQPYTGFVYKALDIIAERDILTIKSDTVDREYSAYIEDRYKFGGFAYRTDMRLKFGMDIKITPKVTLNGEWASGNIVGDTRSRTELTRAYNSQYDYFENANADGDPMAGSVARAGVMSVGLKVAF